MTPEISEFSYGFALTNEIVGWAPVRAAPLFPSLIEEGKAGGGYDVKLDMPGVALYLQFKRADCMIRRNVREVYTHKLALSLPFYRFKITESGKSDQHELLLALDDGSCLVFYAAPLFHQLAEINDAWNNNVVATRSVFVAPTSIGPLDTESHHIAYDRQRAWVCSDPEPIHFLNGNNLIEQLHHRLESDRRPLREKIPELVEGIHLAEQRAAARIAERAGPFGEPMARMPMEPLWEEVAPRPPIPTRGSRALSEPELQLRQLSDTAARLFDVQLIVVQPPGEVTGR
jgi:hypothetical protein